MTAGSAVTAGRKILFLQISRQNRMCGAGLRAQVEFSCHQFAFRELERAEKLGLIRYPWLYFVCLVEEDALSELNGSVTSSVIKNGSKMAVLQQMATRNLTRLQDVDLKGTFIEFISLKKLANSNLIDFIRHL